MTDTVPSVMQGDRGSPGPPCSALETPTGDGASPGLRDTQEPPGSAPTRSGMAPHPPHSPPALGAGDYKQQQLAQAVKPLNKDSKYPIIK